MKKSDLKFITHEEHKRQAFAKSPSLKAAYDALEPEYKIIEALIVARNKKQISQREFAKRIKITQSALARFESGKANPTLSFLGKVTKGLDLVLTVKSRDTI